MADDKKLEEIVQQMIDSGSSQDEIAKLVHMYDDDQHPFQAVLKGGAEGVGAGLVDLVKMPYHLVVGPIADAISVAKGDTPENAKALLDGIHSLPDTWANASLRERAKMVSELVTGMGASAGLARMAPVAAPEAARKIGSTLESLGTRTKSTLPIGGGYAMMRGIETLNPLEFAGGAAVATAPTALRFLGRKLQSWAIPAGEAMETPAGRFLKLQQDIEGAERAGSMQPPMLNSARQRIAATAAELQQRLQNAKFPDELKAIQSEQDRLTSLSDQLDKLTDSPAAAATVPGIGSLSAADVQQLQKQGVSENAILRLAGVKEPSASGAGSVKLPTKPTVRNRSLSPGEEAGISELDDFQQQRAGTVDVLPQGNGGFTAPPVLRTAHPISIDTAQGGMEASGKIPLRGNIEPNKASGSIRANVSERIPGLEAMTRNDAIAIGLHPDYLASVRLTPELIAEINKRLAALRSGRSQNYAVDVASGKSLSEAYPGLSVRRPDEP